MASCGKKMAKGGMADIKGRAMKGGSIDRIGRAVKKDRRDPDIGKMMKETKTPKLESTHMMSATGKMPKGYKAGGEMMVSPRKRMAMGKGK